MDFGPLMATVAKAALFVVKKVSGLLDRVHSPVMVLGSQSMLSPERVGELVDAVDQLGMPVFLTVMARGLLGEDHRLQIRYKRKDALKHTDLVILAGIPCDFRMDYCRVLGPGARLVAANHSKHDLNRDSERIPRRLPRKGFNLNRKPDVALHADPLLSIVALARETTVRDGNLWIDPTDFRKGSISM